MIPFNESVSSFLFYCQYQKNLSEKTQKAYSTDLYQFTLHLKKIEFNGFTNQISKVEIKSFLQSISFLRPKSIRRKMATLKAIFSYLNYEDIIEQNPFNKLKINIKDSKLLPAVMNLSEVSRILHFSHEEKNKSANTTVHKYKENLRNLIVIELLFALGARVSELSNLNYKNVDLKNKQIKIIGKGKKERVIPICNHETIAALNEYYNEFKSEIHNSNFFLINRLKTRLSDQSIRIIVKKYAKMAKIKKSITPHTYRHTFATLLLERDVDLKYIQHMLGHSSIMTTQIYTHVSSKKQEEILKTKHPRHMLVISK